MRNDCRLDVAACEEYPELSRTAAQRLIESGNITVNGKAVPKNYKVSESDSISVDIPKPKQLDVIPQSIPLDIIYEDGDLLVVNKPKGMVVHPAPGNHDGTLVNALLAHCGDSLSGINGVIRPGIVHRIDKDTSGLLIVAKNDASHQGLATQIKEHSFLRKYEAVIIGKITEDGTIDAPIGRHPKERKKMTVTQKNSKKAVTHYRVIENYSGYTHLELTLETGRTHQIRVHMASLGHPVAGDIVYGAKKAPKHANFDGQCLHARSIGFIHPSTGEYLEFTSPLPDYFTDFVERIKES